MCDLLFYVVLYNFNFVFSEYPCIPTRNTYIHICIAGIYYIYVIYIVWYDYLVRYYLYIYVIYIIWYDYMVRYYFFVAKTWIVTESKIEVGYE